MINNFIITGFGRSGTKFLSSVMNKSKIWTILHEPNGDVLNKNIFNTNNQNYYGEVNSYLRYSIQDINVHKKGLILRNPNEIIFSIFNRKNEKDAIKISKEFNNYYNLLKLYDYDIIIDFHKMISDKKYLIEIINFFDIDDIDISNISLEKKNQTTNVVFSKIDELPEEIQKLQWKTHDK